MKKVLVNIMLLVLSGVALPCLAMKTLPDSLLCIEKAYDYSLESTNVSLAIIDGLRTREKEPEWRLSLVEGDVYSNVGRFHKAVECYERALETSEAKKKCELQSLLWSRMMYCHDVLLDELMLMDDIFHLRRCAERCDDDVYLALADFMMGKRLHMHNDNEKAFKQCHESLDVLRKSEFENKMIILKYCYMTMMVMYQDDQRYDEARKMALSAEKIAKSPVSSEKISGERAYWLRYFYGAKASLLAEAGRMAEAEETYKKWKDSGIERVHTDAEIVPFLLATHRAEEALEIVLRYKRYLCKEGDSIEIRMLKAQIYEGNAYSQLGQYDKAGLAINGMSKLAVKLHEQVSKEEMNTRYESLQEKEALHRRSMWMLGLSIAMLSLLLVAGVLMWHYRYTFKNNQRLQKAMNRARAYQKAVLRADEVSEKMQELLQRDDATLSDRAPANGNETKRAEQPEAVADDELTMAAGDVDDDEMLFVLLDKQVTKRQLFLNPNLSREDLMRLIGVDKNRIGRIMSRYSDASNISTYINQKRAYYAAEYIRNHPDYTVAAVVKACGMSNAVTLNRTFKDIFGISPSTYRQKVSGGEAPESLTPSQ